MITAVDSSVILDVLSQDIRFADKSANAIRAARRAGRLIVCETVVAEISPTLESEEAIRDLMESWGLYFEASDLDVALHAGSIFKLYLERGGSQARVVPDFLVGAHAVKHASRLLARDRGYLRDYFPSLLVIDPTA